MNITKWFFAPVYDEPAGDPPAADPPADPPPTADKTFTQEQVNTLLATEKRKQEQKNSKRITQLEAIRDSSSLTKEENDSLNQQIEDLSNEYKTEKQLAAENSARTQKKYETDISKLTQDKEEWQNKYTNMVIINDIVSAASGNDAFENEQIVAILQPKTRLAEAVDDEGKKTGFLESKVKFTGLDNDGNSVELDISPKDAVKRMTEMEKYGNLFKGSATGGLGADNKNRGAGGLGDMKNTANYMKNRKKAGM